MVLISKEHGFHLEIYIFPKVKKKIKKIELKKIKNLSTNFFKNIRIQQLAAPVGRKNVSVNGNLLNKNNNFYLLPVAGMIMVLSSAIGIVLHKASISSFVLYTLAIRLLSETGLQEVCERIFCNIILSQEKIASAFSGVIFPSKTNTYCISPSLIFNTKGSMESYFTGNNDAFKPYFCQVLSLRRSYHEIFSASNFRTSAQCFVQKSGI